MLDLLGVYRLIALFITMKPILNAVVKNLNQRLAMHCVSFGVHVVSGNF